MTNQDAALTRYTIIEGNVGVQAKGTVGAASVVLSIASRAGGAEQVGRMPTIILGANAALPGLAGDYMDYTQTGMWNIRSTAVNVGSFGSSLGYPKSPVPGIVSAASSYLNFWMPSQSYVSRPNLKRP